MFSYDYPDDPALQAGILNKAYELAAQVLDVLNGVNAFAKPTPSR